MSRLVSLGGLGLLIMGAACGGSARPEPAALGIDTPISRAPAGPPDGSEPSNARAQNAAPTGFRGVLAGADAMGLHAFDGTISVTIDDGPAVLHPASAVMNLRGGSSTIVLTGSYGADPACGTACPMGVLELSGSGYVIGVAGSFGADLHGGIDRAESPRLIGLVALLPMSSTRAVDTYCGTFEGDDRGRFDFAVGDNVAVGTSISPATGGAVTRGAVTAAGISFVEYGLENANAIGGVTATRANGTWMYSREPWSGTWSASTDCK